MTQRDAMQCKADFAENFPNQPRAVFNNDLVAKIMCSFASEVPMVNFDCVHRKVLSGTLLFCLARLLLDPIDHVRRKQSLSLARRSHRPDSL